jgi:hypothetical protein
VGLALLVVAAAAHANSVILTSTDAGLGEQGLWINEEGRNVKLDWTGGINATIDGMFNRVLWSGQAFVDNNLHTNYNTVIDSADTAQLKRVGWMMANVVQSVIHRRRARAFSLPSGTFSRTMATASW